MKRFILLFTVLIFILFVVLLLRPGRVNNEGLKHNDLITVSILPLKHIVEGIVDNDFEINVLAPADVSPENYELNPRQLRNLAHSKLLFTTGLLDFERNIFNKLNDKENNNLVELNKGINLLKGSCTDHSHGHGVDPHIWISPKQLRAMSETAYKAIALLYPDSIRYYTNYKALDHRLALLDEETEELIKGSAVKSFIIYHPALTYYSADYNIEQIAIENDGKEPSAERMRAIIERAKNEGINTILIQKQLSHASVETISHDIGAEIVAIDPLAEDVIDNIMKITRIIIQ